MIDLFLRADTEAELIAALPWARGEDEDGGEYWLTAGPGWALDVIGPVARLREFAGAEIEPPVIDGRFHANLRLAAPGVVSVTEAVIVSPEPSSPARWWE